MSETHGAVREAPAGVLPCSQLQQGLEAPAIEGFDRDVQALRRLLQPSEAEIWRRRSRRRQQRQQEILSRQKTGIDSCPSIRCEMRVRTCAIISESEREPSHPGTPTERNPLAVPGDAGSAIAGALAEAAWATLGLRGDATGSATRTSRTYCQ